MDRQLPGHDPVTRAGLVDELPGEDLALTIGNHPADGMTTEDVHDHIQVKTGSGDRAFELRNVPRPDLSRRDRQKLGCLIVSATGLLAPLAPLTHLAMAPQQAIHRAGTRKTDTLVE